MGFRLILRTRGLLPAVASLGSIWGQLSAMEEIPPYHDEIKFQLDRKPSKIYIKLTKLIHKSVKNRAWDASGGISQSGVPPMMSVALEGPKCDPSEVPRPSIFIDFHRFSISLIHFHRLSSIFLQNSSIFIDLNRVSFKFHRFSSIFINFQ